MRDIDVFGDSRMNRAVPAGERFAEESGRSLRPSTYGGTFARMCDSNHCLNSFRRISSNS
jgi:hypothetical protein